MVEEDDALEEIQGDDTSSIAFRGMIDPNDFTENA
jgi:hypothetical protein